VRNVFHILFAVIDKARCHLAAHRAVNRVGNRDSANLGQRLQSRGGVHAIAIDRAITLLKNISKMDTDAKAHLPIVRGCAMGGLQVVLNRKGCRNRTACGLEHCKHRVARHVDDTALVGFDLIAKYRSRRIECGHCPTFVDRHQARVASRVGGQDGRQALTELSIGHSR
jgi:hypothetical protein